MVDRGEDLKKNLAEALKVFGITLPDNTVEKKEKKEEELSDFEEMASRTRSKIDELNEKGEEMLQKTGMTRESLEVYGNNPNNFTKEQWDALQKIKEVAEEYRTLTSEWMVHTLQKEPPKKEKKKPKEKFAKKKNWIPL